MDKVKELNAEAKAKIESQIAETKNAARIVANVKAMINGGNWAGNLAPMIAEALNWLNGVESGVKSQVSALESLLPQPERIPLTVEGPAQEKVTTNV